jgi:hypothetical protein
MTTTAASPSVPVGALVASISLQVEAFVAMLEATSGQLRLVRIEIIVTGESCSVDGDLALDLAAPGSGHLSMTFAPTDIDRGAAERA